MRIGVLGGTHFIGVHLAQALLARGDDITLLHRGLTTEPVPFTRPVSRILGDRRDPRALDDLLARPLDAIFDLSAYGPDDIVPMLHRSGRFGAYALVSTSSVYRIPAPVPYAEDAPTLDDPATYGGGKLAAEAMILASSKPGHPTIALRPQAVTGPYGGAQALHALRRAAAGTPVLLRPGTEDRRLCPLWVGDIVAALLRAIEEPRAAGLAFDLAGPDPVTAADFARAAARACGGTANVQMMSAATASSLPWLGLPWLDHDLVATCASARTVLGIQGTPLSETLARTWAWACLPPRRTALILDRGEADALAGRITPRWRRLAWSAVDRARAPLSKVKRRLQARSVLLWERG